MKLLRPAFILALLLSLSLSAGETPAKTEGKRFLFIIDTSLAMARQAKTMPDEVMKLLQSGMQRHLSEGDTIGLWTYSEELKTGEIPLQQWKHDQARIVLARISDFLSTRPYSSFADFTTVTGKLLEVARHSHDLTIVLISDGSNNVHGTPYDDPINANYREHGTKMRSLSTPFMTALLVQDGKFINYAVNTPLQSLKIPQMPLRILNTAQKAPAVVSTADKSGSSAISPVSPDPSKVAPATNPLTSPPAGTRTVTVHTPGTSGQSQLKIVEKWPAPLPTVAPTLESKNDGSSPARKVQESNTHIAQTENQPAQPATPVTHPSKSPAKTGFNELPRTPAPTTSHSGATKVAARTVEPSPVRVVQSEARQAQAPIAIAAVQSSPFTTTDLMMAIIVLLLIVILLMYFLLRRSRQTPQPSLITAYMDHHQMR